MLRPDPGVWVLLLVGVAAAQPHTDPSGWKEPRIYHAREESRVGSRILIDRSGPPAALLEPVHSPNNAYYFMVMLPNAAEVDSCTTRVFVCAERDYLVRISFIHHYLNFSPSVSWINEKLLFIRVWWGRILGTDLIYDVEQEQILYEEAFRDGRILFEQQKSSSGAATDDAVGKEAAEMTEQEQLITGFAEVNGAQLYYEVSGRGRPLLLLHAGVADSRMWDHQFTAFARHHRVIRFDMRGFGRSALVPGAFSYHEDAASLLEFLGVERAYVIGQSFGGQVAIDLAVSHPEMVAALVLGAPSVGGHEFSNEVLRFEAQEESALGRGDLEAAVELNLQMWVDGPYRGPDDVDPEVRELVRTMLWKAFNAPMPDGVQLRSLAPPATSRLEEVQVPTLVIVGDLDVPEFLALSDTVKARIPGAEKLVISGTAHLPSMERPEEFNRVVLDFLRDLQ